LGRRILQNNVKLKAITELAKWESMQLRAATLDSKSSSLLLEEAINIL